MITLPDHFDSLLTNIQPRSTRISLAQEIPASIRKYLKETDLLATVDPQSRLAGSYSRSTAIKNIKDVDLLVFINPLYKDDKVKGPQNALNDLLDALRGFPEAQGDENGSVNGDLALRKQRRSVCVTFTLHNDVDNEEETFNVDVVPVILADNLDEPLWIPDKEWSKWIKTDPLGYGKYLSSLNKVNGYKVIPLIKMLKHWRDVRMVYRRPKSYWLECILVNLIDRKKIEFDERSYAEIFSTLLNEIYLDFEADFNEEKAVPKVPDPMLGNNVAWNWERSEFETFMRRVNECSKWAIRALESNDEEEAIGLWQNIFNRDDQDEFFPTKVEDSVKELAAARNAGTIRVTPAGTLLTGSAPGITSWASPAHRFYGMDNEQTAKG